MKFRIRYAYQIVGLFILIAIIIIAFILFSMGINQRWFAKNYHFYSIFNSAKGLNSGMSITFKGFKIGKITDITLTKDNTVRADFYIRDDYYEKVYKHSMLRVTSSPIGLGGGLVFYQGAKATEPLKEHSFIPSYQSKEGQTLIEQDLVNIPEQDDPITQILDDVKPILGNTSSTIESVDGLVDSVQNVTTSLDDVIKGKLQGPIGNLILSIRSLVRQTETTITEINQNVQSTVSETNETIAQAEKMVQEVNKAVNNINTLATNFQDPEGLIWKLLTPPNQSVEDFLTENKVILEKLRTILEEVDRSLNSVQSFIAYLNETRPQISGLLEEGRDTIGEGKDVIQSLKNNPLLKRGIPKEKTQPSTFQSYRDEDF